MDRIPSRSIDLDDDFNLDIMYDNLFRLPSEGWMDRAGSLVGVPIITCTAFASLLTLTMGGCRNFFLVFVSDHSRSGLAKKLVQILDSLDVLP